MSSWTFTVTPEGKLPIGIKETLLRVIPTLAGKRMTMSLNIAKKYSSDPQRAYYFGVIVPRIQGLLLTQGGKYIDDDDIHSWLMWNVGKWVKEKDMGRGEKMLLRRSYTDLSTVEAEEHHTKCRKWAAERGCDIPEPNEGVEIHG